MTIATNADLKAFLAAASMRSDLTPFLQDFINSAHARIAAKAIIYAPLTLDSSSVNLPSDFGRIHALYLVKDPVVQLTSVSADQLADLQNDADVPQWFNVAFPSLGLGPTPDQAYEGRLLYKVSPTFFAADGDTNAVLKAYPLLYVHGAMAEIARFNFDTDTEDRREALFGAALDNINEAELAKALAGQALQLTSNSCVV